MVSACAFVLLSLSLFTMLDAAVTNLQNAAVTKFQSDTVRGVDAQQNQVPYMAGIFELSLYVMHSLCGGAILSNRVIMTSAKCIEKSMEELKKLVVILGSPPTAFDNDAIKTKIDHVSLPPYKSHDSKTREFDLALIRTTERITFSDVIQPVALPNNDLTDERVAAFVSGYGLVKEPVGLETNFPATLQTLQTSTVSYSKCLYKYYKIADDDNDKWNEINDKITQNNVCTSNMKNRGICIGDNGSPLVADGVLIAIASWTFGCAQGFPDVYTKIYPHLKWIITEKKHLIHRLT